MECGTSPANPKWVITGSTIVMLVAVSSSRNGRV